MGHGGKTYISLSVPDKCRAGKSEVGRWIGVDSLLLIQLVD